MQIKFDPNDPAVKEMISQWQDGGKYYVTLNVTQDSGATGDFTVDEVVDYGEAEPMEPETETEETESEMPMESAMPPAAAKAAEAMAKTM